MGLEKNVVIAWLSVFKNSFKEVAIGGEQLPDDDVLATNECATYDNKLNHK